MAEVVETAQPDVLTVHLFQIFNDIRKELVEEGGIYDLPLDFPIVEMPYSDDMSNYLGMCHFTHKYESAVELKRIKKRVTMQSVDRITMRVLCKPTGDGATSAGVQHFHLLRLIPTLLHEFAHATCELGRTLSEEESALRNRKLKALDHHSHDDLFYEHFRRILKAAELLGIYSLPPSPNKYNCPSLRRFDQVDLEACPIYLCGSSKKYDGSINVEQTDFVEIIPTPVSHVTLNLTIINSKGLRKFVQLKDGDLAALVAAVTKKFGLKQNFKLSTPKGVDIDNDNFSSIVSSGDTLHIK
jgi:hypothetical protein